MEMATAHDVYREGLMRLQASSVPFLVGGAFALESYTGLVRRTKSAGESVKSGKAVPRAGGEQARQRAHDEPEHEESDDREHIDRLGVRRCLFRDYPGQTTPPTRQPWSAASAFRSRQSV